MAVVVSYKTLSDLGVHIDLKVVTSVPKRKQRDQNIGMQVTD